MAAPFYFFLNKIQSLKDTHNDPRALVFPDLLSPSLGEIVESVQVNILFILKVKNQVVDCNECLYFKAYETFGLKEREKTRLDVIEIKCLRSLFSVIAVLNTLFSNSVH